MASIVSVVSERRERKVRCEILKELLWTVGEGGCDQGLELWS